MFAKYVGVLVKTLQKGDCIEALPAKRTITQMRIVRQPCDSHGSRKNAEQLSIVVCQAWRTSRIS
jgi:hypothetical protein